MTDNQPPPTLASDAGVDASPISPIERRNSLEKHLQTRPEEQDLKNRHILLDTHAAPALQARQAELERQRATDNLKKGLSKRPERDELVEREFSCGFVFVGVCLGFLIFSGDEGGVVVAWEDHDASKFTCLETLQSQGSYESWTGILSNNPQYRHLSEATLRKETRDCICPYITES